MQFEDREQKEEEMVQSRERSEGGVQIDEKVGVKGFGPAAWVQVKSSCLHGSL